MTQYDRDRRITRWLEWITIPLMCGWLLYLVIDYLNRPF